MRRGWAVKRQRREVNFVRQQIENSKQFAKVPTGHVAGMAAARVFGPHDATTPEGHPILIMSGVFDATTETPQEAISRAAYRWLGIMPHPDHWEVEMHEQVNIAPAHPMFAKVQFNEFWHLRYTPEAWKYPHKGIRYEDVTNSFKSSWYLSRNWQKS